MKVMVLAAGMGSRLTPLTNELPKPLVPLNGVSLLRWIFHQLEQARFSSVIINTYHLAGILKKEIKGWDQPLHVSYSDEKELLGTGGGIAAAQSFFNDESVMILNGDVFQSFDLEKYASMHKESGAAVSLFVHNKKPFRLYADEENRLLSWKNKPQDNHYNSWGYACLQCIEPHVVELMPTGRFEIFPFYMECLKQGIDIRCIPIETDIWSDIGTWEDYAKLWMYLKKDSSDYAKELNNIGDKKDGYIFDVTSGVRFVTPLHSWTLSLDVGDIFHKLDPNQ